ncbi:MAG: glycosyltransferase family 1 protein [Chloroflexi bacterium]|jgi:D-inositol-3-phosphate glycosyltransferase|uniref:Glycosyltransferase family 1 protein n=1 Tax=Candidatus Thermofonsia Clade 3 bacterium TaxID=2364212 RepID=A0A2M8QE24_9CHLR|nr:glycosyltransferase [Candidatus Roseilinea sp. NK_OTU-006]PJF48056.1 MAG: glycosyltransferase family 1 protein [Candidatus Thermofonsia Clade 3 bacterium]RMG63820.1 MAG: glycosyltransferase family 1 protein [Chloroflexota bacterium]
MRIALISFHTSPLATLGGKDTGGMNVFVREVARELSRRGIATDVFTRSQSAQSLRIDPRLGPNVRVINVPAGPEAPAPKDSLHQFVPAFTEWICRFTHEESRRRPPYDAIHAHYWLSGLVAEALRACWGVKFAITFHTLAELKNQIAPRDQERESEIRLRSECHLCSVADRITANTSVEKQQLVRFYGAGSSRIRIVPPGVDLSLFHPIEQNYAKSVVGIPPSHRMILFAGRIERLKGIDTLFKAMALLKAKRDDWDWDHLCVVVIGGDPSAAGQRENEEMARLHELRDELGLDQLVIFLGARDQDVLQYYYAAAEMLVMPSHYESFGMVALEAMACGTPVIASDVGGLSVLVQHNKTGLRVKVNDPAELARAIEKLMDDDVHRRRMGHAASCYAEAYAWPKVVEKLLGVYRELAEMGGR